VQHHTAADAAIYDDWRVYHEQQLPKILQAALDAFAETGYHGTTTRQLAERSGLSVPGIYHHYRSKQDILFDLMMVVIDELIERTRLAIAGASDTPRDQFDAVVTSMLLFHMHRQLGAIVSTSELRSLESENRVTYVARRDEQQRVLDQIVAAGVDEGVFETPYPADASRAIASLCVGVASWYRPGGPLSIEALVARFLTIAEAIVGIR
jgi:acetoacetyl-CoA synthetase